MDTALHILKGAIVTVLKTPLTIAIQCAKADEGRISVEYQPAEKPSDEQVRLIEQLANKKIQENVPVDLFKMKKYVFYSFRSIPLLMIPQS